MSMARSDWRLRILAIAAMILLSLFPACTCTRVIISPGGSSTATAHCPEVLDGCPQGGSAPTATSTSLSSAGGGASTSTQSLTTTSAGGGGGTAHAGGSLPGARPFDWSPSLQTLPPGILNPLGSAQFRTYIATIADANAVPSPIASAKLRVLGDADPLDFIGGSLTSNGMTCLTGTDLRDDDGLGPYLLLDHPVESCDFASQSVLELGIWADLTPIPVADSPMSGHRLGFRLDAIALADAPQAFFAPSVLDTMAPIQDLRRGQPIFSVQQVNGAPLENGASPFFEFALDLPVGSDPVTIKQIPFDVGIAGGFSLTDLHVLRDNGPLSTAMYALRDANGSIVMPQTVLVASTQIVLQFKDEELVSGDSRHYRLAGTRSGVTSGCTLSITIPAVSAPVPDVPVTGTLEGNGILQIDGVSASRLLWSDLASTSHSAVINGSSDWINGRRVIIAPLDPVVYQAP